MSEECRSCFTCQSCFTCEGTCYTCQVNYNGDTNKGKAIEDIEIESTEFPDIYHAIYDALDRIAYQLERQNLILKEISSKFGNVQKGRNVNRGQSERSNTVVRRRVLKSIDEELKNVPDKIKKVDIKKQLKLD